MRRRAIASGALLLCLLAAWSCGAQHDFLATLIDTVSKKPVPSARIILAPKKEGKLECTIDTSLTAVSNDRGEVRIRNVEPGEYVVFYNLSGSLNPELKGKVVKYVHYEGLDLGGASNSAIHGSLGGETTSSVRFVNGMPLNEIIYSSDFDLAMIALPGGELQKVSVPGAGSGPVRIEIITDLPPPSPPRGAPKSGR